MDPKRLFSFRLMAADPGAGGGGGGGGGGAEDRGDDFEATDDDAADTAAADAAAAAAAKDGDGKDSADAGKDGDDKEGKDGDGKDGGKGATGMPFSRHKELIAKERDARKELEKQLAQYQQGDRITVINEKIQKDEERVAALDVEYAALVTDGQHEKAAAKAKEIRTLERSISDQKTTLAASAAESRAIERVRYETTVDRLETAYPVLNPEHEDYDGEQAQDVLDLAETYNKRGSTPAEALQKAAKKLLGADTKKQEDAVGVTARVSEEEKAKALAEERRKAQVAKNLAAKGKQPNSTTKVGENSDKAGGGIDGKSVLAMKFDDFVKLDEEVLARLRGDVVA